MSAWQTIQLGDVTTKVGSGSTPRGGEDAYKPSGVPLIRSMNVHFDGFRRDGLAHLDDGQAAALRNVEVQAGDVLLNITGASIGRVTVAPADMHGARVNQHVCIIRPDSRLDSSFLRWHLASPRQQRFINSVESGATRQALTKEKILGFQVPLPPLAEQRATIAEIEKQFSRLDEAVAGLQRVKANLKRYKAAVLKAAVEGRLVPTEADLARREDRNYETGAQLLQRILEVRRSQWQGKGKYKEPAAPDTTDLPELPEGWAWARLDSIAALKGGITVDSKRQDPTAKVVPYLRVANVQRGYLDLSEIKAINAPSADIEELRLRHGDILFNEGGDRDKLGRGWIWEDQLADCIHQNHVFRARLVSSDIHSKLVSWWGNSFGKDYFQREGKQTTNLASINLGKLSAFPVPLPPVAEQHRIVTEVDRLLSIAREAEAEVETNLKRAQALRQAVLARTFSPNATHKFAHIQPPHTSQALDMRKQHFIRAVLSAEIVHRLHGDVHFGRVKHQKILHLCEHLARIEAVNSQYFRQAAGPLDNKMIYANEAELKRQKWYETLERKGQGHYYRPLAKAGGHAKYLSSFSDEQLAMIGRLIELMRTWDTERCEIFSTTFAAWNDLLIWGKPVTDEAILHEILHRWNDSKRRIDELRWQKAIGWMKKEGFVPSGFGKPTRVADTTPSAPPFGRN